MGLEEAGRLYISKNGKGLMFKVEDRAVSQYFTSSKAQSRELIEGKRVWVSVFRLTGKVGDGSE